MRLALATENDRNLIEKLCNEQKIEVPTNNIDCCLLYEGDKLVGFASFSLMAEVSIALNPEQPPRIRSKALRALDELADSIGREHGFKRIHAVCKDAMSNIISKHLGYKKIESNLLYKDI